MLEMICYDIFAPRHHDDLAGGVFDCGKDNHNFSYAPWFVDTRLSPMVALSKLVRSLDRDTDNLMVLNLGAGASSAMLNPKPVDKRWLADHGINFRGLNRSGVLGIAYTLHGAKASDYGRLGRRITRSFPDYFKPVKALYFVATDESARHVRDRVKAFLPNRVRRNPDELLVLEIPASTTGETQFQTGDGAWFRRHGIRRVH